MKLNIEKALGNNAKYQEMLKLAQEKFDTLTAGTGEGNDFLGWLDLPTAYSDEDIEDMDDIDDIEIVDIE